MAPWPKQIANAAKSRLQDAFAFIRRGNVVQPQPQDRRSAVQDLPPKQVQEVKKQPAAVARQRTLQAVLTQNPVTSELAQLLQQLASPARKDIVVFPEIEPCGDGHEIILQVFNWESHKNGWYRQLKGQVADIARAGITCVWMPPPSDSVSPQGYLPRDLYSLNSAYGSEADLRGLVAAFHQHGIKVVADVVINHRCAHFLGEDGKWNQYGGCLAWDASAIASGNPAFGGLGGPKRGEDYAAAPNIDHSQASIREDLSDWLQWLRRSVGFDGWRLDFVRGFAGEYTQQYIEATSPYMAIGEFWDSCEYTHGVLNYNQDAHRRRTVDWCDATGGTSAAFDFTTKGILQEALSRHELWRLTDSQGRPPGVLGLRPDRAVTFIENHDTGSTLNHWPFPSNHLHEGYAYLLTHPGTPTVFWDHFVETQGDLRTAVLKLIAVRKKHGINARSKVVIKKATSDVYAAVIDGTVAMKIGPGDWSPAAAGVEVTDFTLVSCGPSFAVWELLQPAAAAE